LYAVDRWRPDHDAVMRICGEARLGRAPVGNARMFSSGNFYRRPRDSLAL